MNEHNLPAQQPDLSPEEIAATQQLLKLEATYTNLKTWQRQMATPPASGWKVHPIIKVEVNGRKQNYRYLPQSMIRALLRYFFNGLYKIEVVNSFTAFNAVCVHVRIHYWHPFANEWFFVDGVGAAGMQMHKGTGDATDMASMKLGAVEMGFPKAKTTAIKNAAKELGAAFGAFLNADEDTMFFGMNETFTEQHVTGETLPLGASKLKQDHGRK